jgi:hypothetical protein
MISSLYPMLDTSDHPVSIVQRSTMSIWILCGWLSVDRSEDRDRSSHSALSVEPCIILANVEWIVAMMLLSGY